MSEKTQKTIRIKWVRSGIGFSHHQKTIVRSLGLGHLNQVVVRPDTPQIRGIVAAVPHLLAIVPEAPAPAWTSVPDYEVFAPEVASAPPAESAAPAPEAEAETEAPAAQAASEEVPAAPEEPAKRAKVSREKVEKAPAKAASKKAKPGKATAGKAHALKKEAAKKGSKPTKGGKK